MVEGHGNDLHRGTALPYLMSSSHFAHTSLSPRQRDVGANAKPLDVVQYPLPSLLHRDWVEIDKKERQQAWQTSRKRWKSLLRSPPRSASSLWPCRASQMDLAKGISQSLDAFEAIFMAGCWKEGRLWDDGYHGWWDDAVKGNSALQSALQRRTEEEVATLNGQPLVSMFLEREKLYDSACLHKLVGLATGAPFSQAVIVHSYASVPQ